MEQNVKPEQDAKDVKQAFWMEFQGTEEEWKQAQAMLSPALKDLEAAFGQRIRVGTQDMTLEESVVSHLAERGYTLTCAESCTGGLLSGRIVNVAGASDVFRESVVTYANKAKRKLTGVKKKTLKKFGAVSPQTAREMAEGAADAAGADAALAVTGIAGPGGGTPEKPVGLVYIACTVKGKTTVKECRLTGSRRQIRDAAVEEALRLLDSCLARKPRKHV